MAKKRSINLKIMQSTGNVFMRIEGHLDGSGACQVEHALKRLQEKTRNCRLIFDLSGIRNFEHFGIAILAKSIRDQKRHFQEISVTGLQASTESIFRRFGVENDRIAHAFL
jgi:anti-anti-sigma factor